LISIYFVEGEDSIETGGFTPNTQPKQDFDQAMDAFLKYVRDMIKEHYKKELPTFAPPEIGVDKGPKYLKVWKASDSKTLPTKSVYCFVDKTNGDILKAASWKAPAKHARGNIYEPAKGYGIGQYGANYLK
jgi:hypothetical protein